MPFLSPNQHFKALMGQYCKSMPHKHCETDITMMIKIIIIIKFIQHHIPFSALTLLVGRQERHLACKKTGCWFVGGDVLTGALHNL